MDAMRRESPGLANAWRLLSRSDELGTRAWEITGVCNEGSFYGHHG
jgi:hypothetical protein